MPSNLKKYLMDILMCSKFYPSIYFFPNPFKIYEFQCLTRSVPFKPTDVILDLGCGAGLQTAVLGRRCGRAIGIDVSQQVIDRALSDKYSLRSHCEFRCVAIENAQFKDDTFDNIFSICVMEHIPDYLQTLRECYRTLKVGGQFVFSVDSLATIDDAELRKKHTEAYAVCRYFQPASLKQQLEEIGFRNVSVKPIFRSPFANRLFIRGLRDGFRYRYTESFLLSFMLRAAEALCPQKQQGIFLVITCGK